MGNPDVYQSEVEAGPSTSVPVQQNVLLTPSRSTILLNIATSDELPTRDPRNTNGYLHRIKGYPLISLSIIDLGYTIKSSPIFTKPASKISWHLILISLIRIATLTNVGLSKRWRFKKSYIVFITGLTSMVSIWKGCQIILMRSLISHDGEDGNGENNPTEGRGEVKYLFITSILAIVEYLSYLILLRVSPPYTNNSSTRLPHSHAQTPSSLRIRSSNTPGSVRFARDPSRSHRRHVSRGTLRSVRSERNHNESSFSRISFSDSGAGNGVRDEHSTGEDVFTSSTEVGLNASQLERRSLERFHNNDEGPQDNVEDQNVYDDNQYEHNTHEDGYDDDYEDEDEYAERNHESDEYDDEQYDLEYQSTTCNPRDQINLDEYENEEYQEDDDDDDDSSSISSSSIIDLPPPLSPSSIPLPTNLKLPRSTSLNLNAVAVQLGNSPIVGPILRKSRSAKFTRGGGGGMAGRSWTSTASWLTSPRHTHAPDQEQIDNDRVGSVQREEHTYGTFR